MPMRCLVSLQPIPPISEASLPLTITLTRTGNTAGYAPMYYRVQTVSSPDGISHSFLGSVDFERGQSTTSFTLPLANDNVYRGNEPFRIRLDRINVNYTYQITMALTSTMP